MIANKIKLLFSQTVTDNEISIPVEMKFDFSDRSDSLVYYENRVLNDILNQDKDFEVARFRHFQEPITKETAINYVFNFVPTGATVNNANWYSSYELAGFTANEVYYYSNSFKNSFFKLDLYDSTNQKTQTNYITLILPVQQGITENATVGYRQEKISTPKMKLDCLGPNKEGYYIYWLKNREFLNINTFYMTAKFFDAKSGVFIKMMSRPQNIFTARINRFNFDQEKYFYYKVKLDYNDLTYRVFDMISGLQVGYSPEPIKWYEYMNNE